MVPLATASKHALLWAGFWEAEPTGRASISKLNHFAELMDHQTIHPNTALGRIIEDSGQVSECYGKSRDNLTVQLADNLWSIASMSFVLGMKQSGQGTVVAVVNKEMDGAHALKASVLAQYEIPTIGMASWGMGWNPHIILIDLRGTCDDTSAFLIERLAAGLGRAWGEYELYQSFTTEDFAKLASPSWSCIDCSAHSGCELDDLAEVLRPVVEAGRVKCGMC